MCKFSDDIDLFWYSLSTRFFLDRKAVTELEDFEHKFYSKHMGMTESDFRKSINKLNKIGKVKLPFEAYLDREHRRVAFKKICKLHGREFDDFVESHHIYKCTTKFYRYSVRRK